MPIIDDSYQLQCGDQYDLDFKFIRGCAANSNCDGFNCDDSGIYS